MTSIGRAAVFHAAFLFLAASCLNGAIAAERPSSRANAEAKTSEPASPTAAAFAVTGFRSAMFGMSQDEVAKAIQKDFGIAAKDIQREANPTEKTTSLIVKVDDLQAGAGPAMIAYIIGYSTKKLFQVNILWGGPSNPQTAPQELVAAANALRNYFAAAGYEAAGRIINTPVGDGSQVIVFRGVDAQGRMTLLTLTIPKPREGAKDDPKANPPPAMLQLAYIEKPDAPDIFRIEKGF